MGILTKNKINKTILYFIGEIAVVIIGIFVAVQLNNLNEIRKNNKEAVKSLRRIATDLSTEKVVLTSYKNRLNKSKEYLTKVLYHQQSKHLDSMYYHMGHAFMHYNLNSEYINLKFSGRLNLIENDTLRYRLVRFYEGTYTFLNKIAENHNDFVQKKVLNYFIDKLPVDTNSLVDESAVKAKLELKDKEFINLINEQIGTFKQINQLVQTEEIDDILSRIQAKIK